MDMTWLGEQVAGTGGQGKGELSCLGAAPEPAGRWDLGLERLSHRLIGEHLLCVVHVVSICAVPNASARDVVRRSLGSGDLQKSVLRPAGRPARGCLQSHPGLG